MTHPAASAPLALEGGPALRSRPLPPWPVVAEDEIEAATAVLRSGKLNYWTGQEVRAFEAEYAAALQVPHAIALANGTLALELALHALGVGPGDLVLTTARSFMASASCAHTLGAEVRFADVDPASGNLSAESLEAAWVPGVKAAVVVHLAGWPADMDPILAWGLRRGVAIVEDCAQAHGATYKGQPVGTMGAIGCFSFCQDKILTTAGEGGLLVTRDPELWRRAWQAKEHGKDPELAQAKHSPGFAYVITSLGTNLRMTEVQGAIGRRILAKLPAWSEAREANALRLIHQLRRHPALGVPTPPPHSRHAYYKLYAYLRPEALAPGWSRDRILAALQAEGVPGLSGSCPELYLEAGIPTAWRPAERLPTAKALGEQSLMFLVHPTLTPQDLDEVAAAVDKVFARAIVPAWQAEPKPLAP